MRIHCGTFSFGVWVFELECRVGVGERNWRVELELESGVGDLRILCGNSYSVPCPPTPDPYLLSTINQLPAFLIDFKKKVSTYHKTGQFVTVSVTSTISERRSSGSVPLATSAPSGEPSQSESARNGSLPYIQSLSASERPSPSESAFVPMQKN